MTQGKDARIAALEAQLAEALKALTPDGGDAARRNVGCSSLSDCSRALEGGKVDG